MINDVLKRFGESYRWLGASSVEVSAISIDLFDAVHVELIDIVQFCFGKKSSHITRNWSRNQSRNRLFWAVAIRIVGSRRPTNRRHRRGCGSVTL